MTMQPPDDPRIVEFIKRVHQAERQAEKLFDTLLGLNDMFKEILVDLDLPYRHKDSPGPMHVAHNLRIAVNHDGRYSFSCDLHDFTLSRQLAEALVYLSGADAPETSAPGGRSDPDELVAWRTRPNILAYLQKSSKTKLRPAYVNNVADKLNKALVQKTGYALIIRGEQGVRLALKRGGVQDLRRPSDRK